jgi:general secretion pathway protein E
MAHQGAAQAPDEGASAFGRYLLDTSKLTPAALDRAEHVSLESGEQLGVVLTRLGLVTERDLADALAGFLHLPLVSAADFPDAPILEERFNKKFLHKAQIIPLAEDSEAIAIAMVNPLDTYAIEAVRFAAGKRAAPRVALPADFEVAYERLYGEGKSEIRQISEKTSERPDDTASNDIERLKDIASEAPVIRLVNVLITRAVEARASDIHIEPMDSELRVRFRIDGVLHEVEAPPQRLAAAIISRVKIMAKLNIAERRLSQDGRIRLAVRGRDIDFRVSTTPTIHGESVVLRILDRTSLSLDFEALGFDDDVTRRLRDVMELPQGILLVTGPTGSGKTTTLYTALLELNTPDRKILTIEDPVEYHLKGVNQVQVKPQIGLTFAGALRSFLRQDPDIMMIGEIRDLETAQIAVQAALTGHLILSTLHTNDAATAVTRLLDMGVEDYLLTSTVNGLVAQRLVRTLCLECRQPYEALPELVERLQLAPLANGRPIVLQRPGSCARCAGTGYHGRTSILEVLPMTDALRQLVLRHAEAGTIRKAAIADGMQSMYMHGMKKAIAGTTTFEEVLRTTRMT